MTCIAGLVHEGKVFIGGDSAGVSTGDLGLTVRADEKVFRNEGMVFGFTSSFRMGQLLRYAFRIPDHDPRVAPDKYMVTTFVDAVRKCLRDGGFATKENDAERGGTFLVGYQGHLYTIYSDYQVAKAADGYAAVGCGELIALGALYASAGQAAEERIRKALEAAERFSAGVRGPFVIEVLE